MNKEAIERTKTRCKKSHRTVRPTNVPKLELERRLSENQQLYSRVRNPKHMPWVYCDPSPPCWRMLTPKQYLFTFLASLLFVIFVVWWAK